MKRLLAILFIIVVVFIIIVISTNLPKQEIEVEEEITKEYQITDFAPFIAHAGGAVREGSFCGLYTNSLEALMQNYELGHRVFEYDFYLTSDNKLACVHDWVQFGNMDGKPLSEEQWLNSKTVGSPVSLSRYTTMMIDNLIDKMIEYPDMFIVTDTKSTEVTDEMAKLEFQLIYDAAAKKDIKVMDRIIPQIYNDEMYDYVTEIYNFPCIIYTSYAAPDKTADDIISFAEKHDNIKIITHGAGDRRFGKADHDRIHKSNKLVYIHTINTYREMISAIAQGVDGFYTDLLLPKDYDIYVKYKDECYVENVVVENVVN